MTFFEMLDNSGGVLWHPQLQMFDIRSLVKGFRMFCSATITELLAGLELF